MQPKYKKPTKGNVHEITVRQHIHSSHMIKLFGDTDGKVEIFEGGKRTPRKAKPADAAFCTYRSWDQKTESIYCVGIETAFFKEVERIVAGNSIKDRDHAAITEYYCLWNVRNYIARQEQANQKLNNVKKLARYIPEIDREELEKAGIISFNDDHELESRFIAGPTMIRNVDMALNSMSEVRWAAIRAMRGEFLCADAYPNDHFIPISPSMALISGDRDGIIEVEAVARINRVSLESASKFYFCRNIENCPVIKTPSGWPYISLHLV